MDTRLHRLGPCPGWAHDRWFAGDLGASLVSLQGPGIRIALGVARPRTFQFALGRPSELVAVRAPVLRARPSPDFRSNIRTALTNSFSPNDFQVFEYQFERRRLPALRTLRGGDSRTRSQGCLNRERANGTRTGLRTVESPCPCCRNSKMFECSNGLAVRKPTSRVQIHSTP